MSLMLFLFNHAPTKATEASHQLCRSLDRPIQEALGSEADTEKPQAVQHPSPDLEATTEQNL